MPPIFRRLPLVLVFLVATPAFGQAFENLEMLENRVSAALGAGVGEPGGPARPIDRRLRLMPCPTPAEIDSPAMGAVAIRCETRGWRIRVPLAAGAIAASGVTPGMAQVRAEPVVRRGDQVEVVALSANFSVSTLGIAEQDGAPGERIRVRTERRSAPFVGQVLADGRVALPGFNGF
jgi:flagella basal body P-ring formation protein FlgA